ncbi:MAG: PDZ domain-containing protein [Acidobacteria bacterium]|nr:PDZ domain-containing protein [Acidobacteriota bacterium]
MTEQYSSFNRKQTPLHPRSKPLSHLIISSLLPLLCLIAAGMPVWAEASAQVAAQQAATNQLDLSYNLDLARPTTHLMEVEITATRVKESSLEFAMPAWAPGRYAIYDFAKNVQEFTAQGASGQNLPWMQTDKQTWRVDTRNCGGSVRVRYKVFGNNLSGSFSQFDASHANINGASVFMYLVGHKPNPLHLSIQAPPGWKIISGFSLSLAQNSFQIPNYDILVDTPLEISANCSVTSFEEDGKTFRVAIHSYDNEDKNRSALIDGLKKIVHSEMAMMPLPDFSQYTFIFHFAPDAGMGDGMEHLNSTQIIVPGSLSGGGLSEALEIAAHEFFHLWNVKRLRPAVLGPFDYSKEVYTKSLWFVEGVTTYYAYLNLLRCGLWTRQDFLRRMASEIQTIRYDPGRKLMSAESSSFHAWFFDRSPQMQETNFANTTISYYDKGALLGMLLDLAIRSRTDGKKSLADVLRLMYQEFYESPPASYYLRGRGYKGRDILDAIDQVAGSNFTRFFQCYVAGTTPLPYDKIFLKAGLTLHVGVSPGTPPSLGVYTQPANTGVKIVDVVPGSPADRAGLSRDDILIAVDDRSLATEGLGDRLSIYPVGADVPFEVERHQHRQIIFVKLGPPIPNVFSIDRLRGATKEEIEIRREWLRRN